jgi:hypothetical protein
VPLDPLDDGRVVPDPGVEAEVPAVDLTESDRTDVAGVDAGGQQFGGLDRVVRHAQRAGEDVGGPPGEDAECGGGPGDAGGDLVERAVAAVPDHHVDAAPCGVLGEKGGVAAAVGLEDLDVVAAAQPAVHDDGVACGHRRGEGIDDEEDLHDGFDRSNPATGR